MSDRVAVVSDRVADAGLVSSHLDIEYYKAQGTRLDDSVVDSTVLSDGASLLCDEFPSFNGANSL